MAHGVGRSKKGNRERIGALLDAIDCIGLWIDFVRLARICILLCHQLSLMHVPLLSPAPEAVHVMLVNG